VQQCDSWKNNKNCLKLSLGVLASELRSGNATVKLVFKKKSCLVLQIGLIAGVVFFLEHIKLYSSHVSIHALFR
jgi:hypothetical protein